MGLKKMFAARKALLKHSKGETEEAYKEYGELFEAGKMVDAKYLLPYSILLMRRGEYEKAAVYFGVSTRMSPDCPQYRAALRSAEALRDRSRKPAWQHGLAQIANALKRNRPAARSFAK